MCKSFKLTVSVEETLKYLGNRIDRDGSPTEGTKLDFLDFIGLIVHFLSMKAEKNKTIDEK